jgi:phosphoribosylanthranilate isomerase
VKICGIRRIEDATLAVDLGASALGFVFWPSSPRYVEPECAARLIASLPPFVTTVGVFVDQPFDFVTDIARALKLSAIQLHGRETADTYARSSIPVIKAVPVGDGLDSERNAMDVPAAAMVLLDAHDPIKRGGTGKTIDWSRAASIAAQRPVVLSGGLDADNVREAVSAVNPSAIDVSSGVEAAPGVKDAGKLRALFAALGRSDARTFGGSE